MAITKTPRRPHPRPQIEVTGDVTAEDEPPQWERELVIPALAKILTMPKSADSETQEVRDARPA